MILLVSATATMGWGNGPDAKNGISMFMDGSGDLPQHSAALQDRQSDQEWPSVLAGGGGACCSCNDADPPQIAGQTLNCRLGRLTKSVSFVRLLKPEPPQAPPRT